MHVGRRVAKLRAAHGESLREAAVRTGVSHTTIARIEKGEITGSFHSTLRKIADGYRVRMEFLLNGRDPRQDFEAAIRRLTPEERSRLYFASNRARIKMVLDFLTTEYRDEFSQDQLAEAMGFTGPEFRAMLDQWQGNDLPEEALSLRLTDTLSRLTGISAHWFRTGSLGSDSSDLLPKETLNAYISLMKKAAKHNIHPQMLDMAIDLLIMKNRSGSAAAPL